MLKLIKSSLLSLSLLGVAFSAQANYKCDQVVEKQGYEACYNYGLKATVFTKYTLKASNLKKPSLPRKGIRFYEEKSIPKKYRATLADWRKSGFDRSHLVSNRSRSFDTKLQKETFSLVCQSLHYPQVNRVALLSVEKLLRRLTKFNGKSEVFSGNIFDRINPKRTGPGRVAIPKYVYKVIHFPNKNKTIAFLIRNNKNKKSAKASSYRVELAKLEKLAGMKFNF